MNDDIIRMAREAGLGDTGVQCGFVFFQSGAETLERFFHMAQAAERERLAKVFDERNKGIGWYELDEPAEIIRAEGKE